METIELTPRDENISVEVSIERLTEEIGTQCIIDGDNNIANYYLAALALECRGEPIQEILMEFIRNSGELEHVTPDAERKIEDLLR